MVLRQKTLNNSVKATGIGLHSGKKIFMTIHPASVDKGILFRRMDLPHTPMIKACPENVGNTRLSTTLFSNGAKVATVEHILSAMAGLGIDNAIIELTAEEVPIMDGSASPFIFLLQSADFVEQAAPKRFLRIKKTIKVEQDDKWARFDPYDGFKVGFEINFNHPAFKDRSSRMVIDFASHSFIKEISRARTFGFVQDIEQLHSKQLALGGSLNCAVVLDNYRVLNEEGLRYEDEFVRHKILDAVGDLYLLGSNLIGSFFGHKSGHELNNKLLKALKSNPEAWCYDTLEENHYGQSSPVFNFSQNI